MITSENATGGEKEPDMNVSENQENPQDVAADAAREDTRDAGVSEETGAAQDAANAETNETEQILSLAAVELGGYPSNEPVIIAATLRLGD